MTTSHECVTVSVFVARPAAAVYGFLADPLTFPRWASGLGKRIEARGRDWVVEGPDGTPLEVRFAPANPFGVVDHWVKPAGAAEIHVPMRVVAQGEGAHVMLSVMRQPGMADAHFARDVAWVERDLKRLKEVLERDAP